MKKRLYASTALAAAGFLAGSVGSAAAAERIQLSVSGYHQQWAVVADQKIKDGVGEHPFDANLVDQKHNSEVCFIGETALDSGINIGVNVQLEANTSSDQIDESFMFLKSDSWGMIQLGDTDNAATKMAITAPHGGVSVNDGDIVGIEAFAVPAGFDGSNTTIDTTPLYLTDNDSGKFNYFTPKFGGFQLGLSYIPQFENGGDNNNSIRRNKAANTGSIHDGFAAAVNFSDTFGDTFGLDAAVGILYGDVPSNAGSDPVFGVNGGVLLTFGGFTVGGSYTRASGHTTDGRSVEGHAYDIGAAYTFGPYKIGLTYIRGISDGDLADDAKQHLDQAVLSGTYTLGPGVDLVGGIFAYDADGEADVAGAGGIKDNSGIGVATGFKLSF